MQPFTTHTGIVAALDRGDVDTDQIISKEHLKRIERTGFGQFLFSGWRFLADGKTLNPSFELNRPEFAGATILLAGRNFGCGSSREHAPWALGDYGFRVIVAPSFADIFYNNCFKNGLLPIKLAEPVVRELFGRVAARPGYKLTADLEKRVLSDDAGWSQSFDVDAFRRHCLLNGLDDIGLTFQHEGAITAYESAHGMSPAVK